LAQWQKKKSDAKAHRKENESGDLIQRRKEKSAGENQALSQQRIRGRELWLATTAEKEGE